jgi:hypothetical protein
MPGPGATNLGRRAALAPQARKLGGMSRNALIAVLLIILVVIVLFATGVLGGGAGGGGY